MEVEKPVEPAKPAKKKSGVQEGDTFHLKVYSPFKTYFEGDVQSLSAVNDTGDFDVLAGHHNFITLLNPCDLVIRASQKEDEVIKVTRGIMQIKASDVIVFLDV